MRINKSISSGLLTAVALALVPHAASAWSPKLEVSDTTWVQLGYLHQFWYQSVDDGAGVAGDRERSSEFFTRRNRVMLLGQATENVHFFLNYDAAAGNGAGARQDPVLTDAMIDFRISDAFKVMVGRQLVPFTIDNNTSAVTLTGIDYPTRALANQPTNPSGAFWRDDGITVRGLLAGGKIDYRAGYFAGDRDTGRNADDDGRYTGMVMYNFASAQGGWFFNQNSLGALDVFTIGAGYDNISRSGATAEDHEAWSLFFTMEKKLGAGHLSFNGTYIDWDGVVTATPGVYRSGSSTSIQAAFLPAGSKWQPVLRWQQQDYDNEQTLDTIGIGLGYYLSGHRINIKAEYSIDDAFVDGKEVDAFRIQTQLFF
ncbi:MAG: porin [Gammaproteobacteria bacterium]